VQNRKTKKHKTDVLRNNSKQSGESIEKKEEKRKSSGGKDLQKRKVLSLE